MQDVASISAMQQFHFGRRIRCSDGEAGLLTQVVFDSASRRVTSLGVTLGGLFGRRVYVSFATVVPGTGESIPLRISRAVLAASRKEAPTGAFARQQKCGRERSPKWDCCTVRCVRTS